MKIKNKNNYKSIHWENFIQDKFININESKLIDFRKNGLSDGLDNIRKVNNNTIKDFFDRTKEILISEKLIQLLPKKNIGNCPNFIKYNEYFVDNIYLEHLLFFLDLKNILKDVKVICEIGGGFGNLGRTFLEYDKKIKYISIDLPEINKLSYYFLNKHFPEKKIIFKDEEKVNLSNDDILNSDIIILPPWSKLNSKSINLFINARSMMEMNLKTINHYFQMINDVDEGTYFYNVNRYFKDTSGDEIKLYQYPYTQNWKVLKSEKAFDQPHIHKLLTQKTLINSDIFLELNKIQKLSTKFIKSTPLIYKLKKFIILKLSRIKSYKDKITKHN